jgi:hypothetical protein
MPAKIIQNISTTYTTSFFSLVHYFKEHNPDPSSTKMTFVSFNALHVLAWSYHEE